MARVSRVRVIIRGWDDPEGTAGLNEDREYEYAGSQWMQIPGSPVEPLELAASAAFRLTGFSQQCGRHALVLVHAPDSAAADVFVERSVDGATYVTMANVTPAASETGVVLVGASDFDVSGPERLAFVRVRNQGASTPNVEVWAGG